MTNSEPRSSREREPKMSRPEEAILEAMQTMQLLNGGLVDRMAAIGPLGLEQPVKRDQLGRTRSKARKDYLTLVTQSIYFNVFIV